MLLTFDPTRVRATPDSSGCPSLFPMAPLSLENILLHVRDFVVVWVAQVLAYNNVYPENAFEQKKYLDIIVRQSRVPALNDYLLSFANEAVLLLVNKRGAGATHELVLLVYRESNLHVLRRYVVDFSLFAGLQGQISSLDFLAGPAAVQLARVDLPQLSWNNIYTHLRSLVFFHVEELKRTTPHEDVFFKLLLNLDDSVSLDSELTKWVRLTSDPDLRKTKFVPLGEVNLAFLSFELHNEYIV